MRLVLQHSIALFYFVLVGIAAGAQAEWIANKGQWPESVMLKTRLKSGTLWTERSGFTYQLYDPDGLTKLHQAHAQPQDGVLRGHVYKVNFVNGSAVSVSGDERNSHYYNYYTSQETTKHGSFCASYGRARLHDVYPGIDVQLYSVGSSLKYDWIIAPGATPDSIALEFEGASCSLVHREHGTDLLIETSVQTVVEKQPYAYQILDGAMREIRCDYVLEGNVIRFRVGRYDHSLPLIIDPEVAFSTFIGSVADNWGFTACDDANENMIAGSIAFAPGYPTTTGAFSSTFIGAANNYFDIAISKFNSDGSQLLYSTYFGGGRQETPHSVIADSQNRMIVFGATGSPDFPISAGAYQPMLLGGPASNIQFIDAQEYPLGTDLFVSKFNEDGTLFASTYIGGSENDGLNTGNQLFYNYGDIFRGEVNVDASDNIYVASVTKSSDFPITQGAFGGGDYDGVLFKLSPSLNTLLQSRYIGGNGNDACYVVEFNQTGQVIVAGGTQSSNFPLITPTAADASSNGETDGFLAILDAATLNTLSGTYVGTSAYDQVYFAQSDEAGFIYTYGQTLGNMPITPGLYGQPGSGQFISKFAPDLSTQEWNTVIGTGNGINISPTAFLVSECGQIYISGWGGQTNSNYAGGSTSGLPTTPDAFQGTTNGSDFYLCVLTPNAQDLLYGSFLGGNQSGEHVDGGTSRFDKNGSVYHAVCAGCGENDDFPTTPGAWSSTNDSENCNLAVFRFDLLAIQAEASVNGPSLVCANDEISFENSSQGATNYLWDFGDGNTDTSTEPTHSFTQGGAYTVQLVAYDNALCVTADTITIEVEVVPDVAPTVQADVVICEGQTTQLNATGSSNLHWLFHATLSALDVPDPIAQPTATTTYYVVDENACDAETLSVVVEVSTPTAIASNDTSICIGQSVPLTVTGGVSYVWSPTTFLNTANSATPTATPSQTIQYTVTVTDVHGCTDEETTTIDVYDNVPGGMVYPTLIVCLGSEVQLQAEPGTAWQWFPPSTLSDDQVQEPFASPSDTTVYIVQLTNSCGVGFDTVTVNVISPFLQAFGGGSICVGDTISAWASGALSYSWSPSLWADPSDEAFTILSPENTTVFEVTGVDAFNCAWTEEVTVSVYEQVDVEAGPDAFFNVPDSVMLYGNALGFECYWWPSDGLACDSCEMTLASPTEPTVYHLAIVDDYGCVNEDSVIVRPYYPVFVPNTFTPNGDGVNDVFRVSGQPQTGFHLVIFDRWGITVFESYDMNESWTGNAGGGYFAPNDVYNWVLEFDSLDRRSKLIGHVALVR
jgi:gliding motility-associated-like protein